MTSPSNVTRRPVPTGQIVGAVAVAVLSAAAWFAWMAWDSEYQVDPVTQAASGPYETWQVVGCGVSLIVVFVAALVLRVRPVVVSVALVVAFTAAWTWTSSRADDTGLFGVGAVMVAVGLSMATAVGSGLALMMRHGYRALGRRPASAA